MALEATNLAAAKIRQDASTAVLAQANSMNRSVADYLLNGALG
jgi:flagellin-like hook-associated protein FlgL